MVTSKITAILAVMCLALAGVGVVVSDNDLVAEDEPKYITVTYDEVIDAAVANAIFKGDINYEATLDEEKLDSVINYEAYQLLKAADMIVKDKVVIPTTADAKYLEAAKKVVMDDMKTVVVVENSSDVAKAFFAAETVADLQTKVTDLEAEVFDLEAEAVGDAEKIAELETAKADLEKAKADLEKAVLAKDKAIAEKDAAIAEKDKAIKEKDDKIAELQKEQPKVPFYETTMGQVALILVAFLVVLIVYYNFDAIKSKCASLKGVKP